MKNVSASYFQVCNENIIHSRQKMLRNKVAKKLSLVAVVVVVVVVLKLLM